MKKFLRIDGGYGYNLLFSGSRDIGKRPRDPKVILISPSYSNSFESQIRWWEVQSLAA